MSAVERLVYWTLSLWWSAVTCVNLLIQWFKNRETFFVKKEHLKPSVLDGWTHESAQLSTVKLHYVEAGDMDKPLMLMIHGFPEFWYSWRYQIKHFEKDYHVVAVDLRGYNESDKPEGVENYKSSVIANDIKELVPALNHDKAILVGHDWGAAIAWTVAILHPEVVEKLIVMNCPHPIAFKNLLRNSFKQLVKSWYMFMFLMPRLPEFVWEADDFKMLKTALRGQKAGIKKKEHFTDGDEQAWLYTFSQPGSFTGPINFYRAALLLQDSTHLPSTPIKAKTLILWGSEDEFLEKEGAEKSTQYCEMAKLHYINGASHWVQQDDPEAVNYHIEEFVKQN